MLPHDIHKKIFQYFALLAPHQKEGNVNLKMTFKSGYWKCESDKEIHALEQDFLHFGKNTQQIICALTQAKKQVKNKREVTNYLHLLGWAEDKNVAGLTLEQYLFSSVSEWSNAAARSLFPLVATGRYSLDIQVVFALLHKRSKYSKNKALGLLAFWPDSGTIKRLSSKEKKYIKYLCNHKETLLVATAARMVCDRF